MFCALEGSRTPNLLIRSQVLYPIELQVRKAFAFLTDCKNRIFILIRYKNFKLLYNFCNGCKIR